MNLNVKGVGVYMATDLSKKLNGLRARRFPSKLKRRLRKNASSNGHIKTKKRHAKRS